jgi:hypothetical protein
MEVKNICSDCAFWKDGCLMHRIPKGCPYQNIVFDWQKQIYDMPVKNEENKTTK